MGNALGNILPMAIGVAISPVPIIAVILMLFSKRARSNGIAFLVGWVLALVVVGSIVLILANLEKISAGGTPSTLAYVLKLLLGLLFLFMAVRQWRGRPKEGEEPHMPKWMASIDQFTPGKAFGFAAVLAGVNPKNLGLTLAAALSIAQANVSGARVLDPSGCLRHHRQSHSCRTSVVLPVCRSVGGKDAHQLEGVVGGQ